MELATENYFHNHYLQDLKRWYGTDDIPEHGADGLICGRTAHDLVKDEKYKDYFSFSHFLAVVYILSNIDSAMGVFPTGRHGWRYGCPPHPTPFCMDNHGLVHDPASMLDYFARSISNQEYLPSHDLLSLYAQFFIPIAVTVALYETPDLNPGVAKETPLPLDDFKESMTACLLPDQADERGTTIYQQLVEARNQRYQAARDEVTKKEAERALEGKARRSAKATSSLFNAVRRGDIKAVRALIAKGADLGVKAPYGISLIEFARINSCEDIAEVLKGNSPSPDVIVN